MDVKIAAYEQGGHLVTPRIAPVSYITGVVLAGGKSSRMGQDKAALVMGRLGPFGEKGPSLAFHMADVLGHALRAYNSNAETWISCQPDRVIPPTHAHLGRVHDAVQGVGPLAGIVAALLAAKGPVFVLACDMPLMQSDILCMLIEARQVALADYTRPKPLLMTSFSCAQAKVTNSPNIEPLVAIYEYASLPYLQDALQKKHFSLRRIIDQEALCVVPYSEKKKEFFFNMNTISEYKDATQLLLRHTLEA